MLCCEHSIVNSDDRQGIAVTLRCKTWSCEICQPFNRQKVVREARAGQPVTFITLTSRPSSNSSPDQRARRLVEAWRLIRRAYARSHKGQKPPFIAVFEATKRGEPHLHILTRARWIDQRWLSAQMLKHCGSPIVDVRRITDQEIAARYCAKYIGKDPRKFQGTKRYWRSLDWLLPFVVRDQLPVAPSSIWVRHRCHLSVIADRLRSAGFEVQHEGHKLTWNSLAPP